jgi:protein-L-isoaspartate(D-aspartate) O-methyltransferase
MENGAARRELMVERQIAARGVRDPQVLRAMRKVPREQFVAPEQVELAYEDSPLPIDEGQTISQPYIVALMAEALELGPADRVLEIGTGSGYAAAVLAEIAREVYSIERHVGLARQAAERLARLDYQNVSVRRGDGTLGWAERAPFDGIAVTAGGRDVPKTLLAQLAIGGRLVIPIGPTPHQQILVRIRRESEAEYVREELGKVQFVPLIADDGELEH